MLSTDEIQKAIDLIAAGAVGELRIAPVDATTREELVGWLMEALDASESNTAYVIYADDQVHTDGRKKAVAVCGNGPSSLANAQSLGAARAIAPPLLGTLAMAVEHIEAAIAALNAGDPESALATLQRAMGGPQG